MQQHCWVIQTPPSTAAGWEAPGLCEVKFVWDPRGRQSGESLLRLLFGIFILSTVGHEAEGEFNVAS